MTAVVFCAIPIFPGLPVTADAPYLDCGLYALKDAARLIGVPQNTLRYWAGEVAGRDSLVARHISDKRLLTFAELMEFHFIKLFKDHGVSLQAIRATAMRAAEKYHTDYPFTVKRFNTDGKSIFATLQSKATKKKLIEDVERCQFVFTKVIRPFFKKLDYRGTNEAERFWPLQKRGRIVLDPTRRFGQPIDDPTGVPTSAIVQALNAGDGQDVPKVANWFDIPPEAVKAAIRFEKSLAP
jgi:uncharacterized protein (DUF433 family)/DNA-binding transcriptional MerR regulator